MATKKPSKPAPRVTTKPKATPQQTSPRKLENLAARPSYDDMLDEQLVDHSGVFRVTSAIKQNQVGHDDDNSPRFASDSLVMRAQRDGFRDDAVTLDEPVDSELVIEDEATLAAKRQRLATLAALAQRKPKRR